MVARTCAIPAQLFACVTGCSQDCNRLPSHRRCLAPPPVRVIFGSLCPPVRSTQTGRTGEHRLSIWLVDINVLRPPDGWQAGLPGRRPAYPSGTGGSEPLATAAPPRSPSIPPQRVSDASYLFSSKAPFAIAPVDNSTKALRPNSAQETRFTIQRTLVPLSSEQVDY
jgi:hypothetical protein